MDVTGIAALVTGGGSGLGAATARALAQAGAKVAALDIDGEHAQAVAAETNGIGVACDVTDEASVQAAIEAAEAKHGAARVLVNCAGIGTAGRVFSRGQPLSLDAFSRVIGVNLIGTFNMVRLFTARVAAAALVGEERGVIVNTASVAAFEGQVGQAAYAASKGGVVAMTLPLARDLAQYAIRVMTIAPGLFLTPMMMGVSEEFQKTLAAQVPFPPRLGDPAEFARLVMAILGNPMLNGETIRLDGAIRMAPR